MSQSSSLPGRRSAKVCFSPNTGLELLPSPPPAVTVSADSLAHPGRGLLSVAPFTGEFLFSCGAIQRFLPTGNGGWLPVVLFCLCLLSGLTLPWVSLEYGKGFVLVLFPFNAISYSFDGGVLSFPWGEALVCSSGVLPWSGLR